MGSGGTGDQSVRSTIADPVAATPGGWAKSTPASNLVNGRHLNPINVWAAGIGTPLRFSDSDARLPEQGGGDRAFGQDNWLIGVDFANFADLANKLGGGQLDLPSFACITLGFAKRITATTSKGVHLVITRSPKAGTICPLFRGRLR